MDKIRKQESAVPVQSRINLISLAEMVRYWNTTGYEICSMSQLVSWSIDLLKDILRINKMIPEESLEIAEAKRLLVSRNLWQKKVQGRSFVKIGTAIRFENLRKAGIDPANVDEASRVSYNILHNKRSVKPSPEIDEIMRIYDKVSRLRSEQSSESEED